jgi:hypothetical protein
MFFFLFFFFFFFSRFFTAATAAGVIALGSSSGETSLTRGPDYDLDTVGGQLRWDEATRDDPLSDHIYPGVGVMRSRVEFTFLYRAITFPPPFLVSSM